MQFVNDAAGITRVLSEIRTHYMDRFAEWAAENELDMCALQLSDLADCITVLHRVQENKFNEADIKLGGMDTCQREYLWEVLENAGLLKED